MPDAVALQASFRRRGAMKRDIGEGGSLIIEFSEREALNAEKALQFTKTFTVVFTDPVEAVPAEK